MTYSFIIPHHNSPELLNRCLDSIPKRDDIQIIVVDDNSKVEFRPNVKRSDVEVVYIDAEYSKGAGHARNVGIERAKGKWLLFADCDDYYIKDFIEILDDYKENNIDVLYFNYQKADEFGGILNQQYIVQSILEEGSTDNYHVDCVKYRNNAPWNKMVNSSFIKKHKIRFEETPNGNDLLFSLKLGLFSNSYRLIPNRLYIYVIHANCLTRRPQSADEMVCRFEHHVKKYEFNKRKGYPEWNDNIIKLFYQTVAGNGFVTCFKVAFKCLVHVINGTFRPKQWALMIN